MGKRLYFLARGIDDRKVHLDDEAKSVSAETTFFEDYASMTELFGAARPSTRKAWRLKKAAIAGHTVVLKLKTQDFKQRTRNRRPDAPSQLADRIFREGLSLSNARSTAPNFA